MSMPGCGDLWGKRHLDKPGAADSQKQRPVTAVGIPDLTMSHHVSPDFHRVQPVVLLMNLMWKSLAIAMTNSRSEP